MTRVIVGVVVVAVLDHMVHQPGGVDHAYQMIDHLVTVCIRILAGLSAAVSR